MKEIVVKKLFSKLNFFKWKFPIGLRKKDHFLIGSEVLHLSFESGRLEDYESGEAIAIFHLSKSICRLGRVFKGRVETDGNLIDIEINDTGSISMMITDIDNVRVTLDINDGRFFNFSSELLSVDIDASKAHWDPSNSHIVSISSSRKWEGLSRVIGVLLCSLFFDHIFDSGGHI